MSHSAISRSSTRSSPKRSGGSGIEGMSRLDRTLPGVSASPDERRSFYRVRRSDRARRVRITVDRAGTVEVVLPQRLPQRAAEEAVAELRPWIDRRLAEVGRQRAAVLARGDTVPYLGQSLTVVTEPGRGRVPAAWANAGRAGRSRAPAGARALVPADGARRRSRARLDRACAVAGLSYTKLTIRDQRTRWGSCSRSGAMSFNWRLLLAPEAVLDYVIWHEVCHLAVMDHSPRFWSLVARMPGLPRADGLAEAQQRHPGPVNSIAVASAQIVAAMRVWQADGRQDRWWSRSTVTARPARRRLPREAARALGAVLLHTDDFFHAALEISEDELPMAQYYDWDAAAQRSARAGAGGRARARSWWRVCRPERRRWPTW